MGKEKNRLFSYEIFMCFSLQWAGTLADDCKQLHDQEVEKRHKFSGRLSEYNSTANCLYDAFRKDRCYQSFLSCIETMTRSTRLPACNQDVKLLRST